MAAPVQGPKPTAPPVPAAPRSRPDFATLGRIEADLCRILGGLLLERGSIQDVAQVTAAMIVLGGTLGAVLVTTPLPVFVRACRGLSSAFVERANGTGAIVDALVQYATKARKNGIV